MKRIERWTPPRQEPRNWERKGDDYRPQSWNNLRSPLRLYVAPWIKERLHLDCQTTVEYLEKCKGDQS